MPTILEEYIANHPGSAQRYAEALEIFPGGVTHDTRNDCVRTCVRTPAMPLMSC